MNTTFRFIPGTLIAAALALPFGVRAGSAAGPEEVTYSTEGYCILANEGVDPRYLAAYEKQLGMKPAERVCASFREVVAVLRPKEWDFRGRKPYPYSAITLSVAQIEAIRAARAEGTL